MKQSLLKLVIGLVLTTFVQTLIAQTPNFVVILVDDQGWTGTSVQMDKNNSSTKSDYYYTPNLEQMATDGMRFSNAYAAAAKCSPSRNAIFTGKSAARTQFTATDNSAATGNILIEPSSNTNINSNETTVAEWLKSTSLNYTTAHYGKWHLGNSGPSSHGFDYGSGNTSNDEGTASDGNVAQTDPKKMYEITDSAINFMNRAVTAGKPFYVQLSHWAVHTDIEATQNRLNWYDVAHQRPSGTTHTDKTYGAMTEDLDSAVGLIMAELSTLGITGTTYVIYTSDNGASRSISSNSPLKRGKTFIYEGGIRVPFLIKGPNITGNTQSDEPIVGYDLLPTIASLSGSTNSLPSNIDGQDLSGIWNGNGFSRTNGIYFHIPHYESNAAKTPHSAIRDGNYKLIVEYETGSRYLYQVSSDLGEDTEVSGSNATLIETMFKELRDHLETVEANMPTLDPSHANFSGTGTDVDNDGLEDEWELRELLSYSYDGTADVDNDAATHQEEHDYNSDPLTNEGLSATAVGFREGSATVLETVGTVTATIALPVYNATGGDLIVAYTVSGTATAGTDFTALSGNVTIASGSNKADITITLTDDNDEESSETIILTLDIGNSTAGISAGTTNTTTITISDNDCSQAALNQSLKNCTDDYTTDGLNESYAEVTDVGADTRTITTTGVPNHDYRAPNGIAEISGTYVLDLTPSQAGSVTNLLGTSGIEYEFGTALNGVKIDPIAAEPFINTSTGEENWSWVLDFIGNTGDLSADCNYAHLQSNGEYHYHGDMIGLANVLLSGLGDGTTIPTAPVQIGWAADGFPIYYKYGYTTAMDNTSAIKELTSNYALKSGSRAGDGVSAPCGAYNGKYMQDYEYNAGNGGDLDECNGRTGVTNEFPSGTYYYVITNAYPVLPRCLMGTPASTYGLGSNALPVELTTFTGKQVDNSILLEWTTLTETNNKGFEIKKSYDGENWKVLDFVEGEGHSLAPTTYTYIDNDIQYGEIYYQLQQVDFDGTTETSQTIVLDIEKPNTNFKIYPNPTTGQLHYELNDNYQVEQIVIFNAIGQVTKQLNNTNRTIDLSDLPKGIYFVAVTLGNGEVLVEKVVKE